MPYTARELCLRLFLRTDTNHIQTYFHLHRNRNFPKHNTLLRYKEYPSLQAVKIVHLYVFHTEAF